IIIFTFLMISNCGYSPIYSNKNFNFDLNKITKKENTRLNSKLIKSLRNFSNKDNENKLDVKIDSKKIVNIIAKNKKGDPSRYEMTISMNVLVINNIGRSNKKKFSSSFNYNTDTNKFRLSQYEKEIEGLLIQKIIEDCIIYFSKI
ncbi:hypothetical protein N9S39_03900, partial [Candidatus Pelagibacter sp.]|nr:hypothetical protein [Candidatus Pelagibacter sp.]